MANTRKVVLFIVEGPSDEAALGGIFTKIFNNAAVKFDVIHGDATTSCQDPAKIREHVRNEILKHLARDRGYGWKDLERIVVICDTDGAFVPSSCIEASSDGRLHYEEGCILARDPAAIVERNAKKSEALKRLSSIKELTSKQRKVPIRTFFHSRNLEHALSGEPGECSNDEKELLAHRFARKYVNDIGGGSSASSLKRSVLLGITPKPGIMLPRAPIRWSDARICIWCWRDKAMSAMRWGVRFRRRIYELAWASPPICQ